ncbi:MAG: NAD(P)/FAD-dependent oxidoreductase [Acetobacteraceae bacterium]|nr:NAD(P)/FAD-dependent oxidoreductase [Acetobacteraceae bacterium]
MPDATQTRPAITASHDVVIVGAGFGGMYQLHRLRGLGLSAKVIDAASGVGGTWYWNRYPGARCDVESMQYSFGFSEEIQQEWKWPELFSAQPDILKYANFVADKLDLRRDMLFDTRVTEAKFDDTTNQWTVGTSRGDRFTANFLIMASGCLSSARVPDFKGLNTFKGKTYHTGAWPHEAVDFTGLRVGVIGTGSSAIQAIPVIAAQAASVTVFQRTPNFSIPSRNGPMTEEYERKWKDDYAALRAKARATRNGIIAYPNDFSALSISPAERDAIYEARWATGGTTFMAAFNDLIFDQAANDTAAEFVRGKIKQIVKDPATAELLAPTSHPIGTKRICVDTRYFEAYNRPNVRLIDVRSAPIEELTPAGLRTTSASYEFDAIVFATGFDAMTGALTGMGIEGSGGRPLEAEWRDGPRTYLGPMTADFPNLFMITGPGSPSVLSNMMVSIEQDVNWITDCLSWLRSHGIARMEATRKAQDDWVLHGIEVANTTLYPKAASWYMGANIPGKPRVFMPYIGGVASYHDKCAEIAANGYTGFQFGGAEKVAQAAE